MSDEVMGIQELAVYLQRDAREVMKMASRGHIPGQKVSGEWRFHAVEINHWLENQMHGYTEQELAALETGGKPVKENHQPILSQLISEATISVPLKGSTKKSLLKELVEVAEQSWQLYDPEAILEAVRQREDMASTYLAGGVALPHPHRPLTKALGDDVLAFGRTHCPIPFGGPGGGMTDLFFLVLCRDYRIHLRVMARLSRLFLRPRFLDELRQQAGPAEVHELIRSSEEDLS
jgi:PTS system nitrogen regulatory IIA component